jgi:hypothetical protein
MITYIRALRIVDELKHRGLKAEIVGGIHKKKDVLHDIDLITREKNAAKDIAIIKSIRTTTPIELYVTSTEHYQGLRRALRATTYAAIQGRLMKGLRFKRMTL